MKEGDTMAVPTEGKSVQIHSFKHDGNIHRIWNETTVLKGTSNHDHWWK